MAPPPPVLILDLVGEILLRVPPDDPALLVRASLTCKAWRRLLTSAAFLRQYRAFHGVPPLLGFLRNAGDGADVARFVPTASFRPRDTDRGCCRVLDCRHGRVLLYVYGRDYIVWDPATGEEVHVPDANVPQSYFNAAVMCAAGPDCDHRDCHGGPFLVALVGTDEHDDVTYACLYSSESGEWCEPSTREFDYYVEMLPPVLVSGAMYFLCQHGLAILGYDLYGDGELWGFERPQRDDPHDFDGTALIPAGDDGLIFAGLEKYSLHLWSMEMIGQHEQNVGWKPLKVIELDTLIPCVTAAAAAANAVIYPSLIGVAPGPDGSDVIFVRVRTDNCVFAISLKSLSIKKVCEDRCSDYAIFPYTSFVTPDRAIGKLSVATTATTQ